MPKASPEYNLYMLNPSLVMEWHPTKNGSLSPRDVTPGSGKKVWWLCTEGHEWQAAIYSRSRGSGCPHCNKDALNNESRLVESDAAILRQWHPTKNDGLRPGDLMPGSGQKVWWLCNEGHEWQATLKSRMRRADCPLCGGGLLAKRPARKKTKKRSRQIRPAAGVRADENHVDQDPLISEMKSGTDFRKNLRFRHQDTVILENPNSGQWSYARSCNISGDGMLFESETPFKTGTRINIQFTRPPFQSTRKTYPSIVRWCKEILQDNHIAGFGIGVKFLK